MFTPSKSIHLYTRYILFIYNTFTGVYNCIQLQPWNIISNITFIILNIIEGIKNKQKKNSEQRKMKNKKKGRDELNYGKQKN